MNLKDISEKRQKRWEETKIYQVKEDFNKPKFYVLDMFPYPSGAGLHVGHPKGYIASDTLARKKMLEGYNVLHPMGFDTFGLGTENYAIEHKMKPQDVAKKNISNYIKQMKLFGCTYDRSRAVNTADPKYFKRTQRIFLQLYNHYYDETEKKALPLEHLRSKIKNGEINLSSFSKGGGGKPEDLEEDYLNNQRLAYVDFKPINRCPRCLTGLANEDLDDGKCERCGSEVEQKPMKQRVLRITKYADRLLEGLDHLHRGEAMKELERNRIGKSAGTQFKMNIESSENLFLEIYTTRIDTVFGMSFVAIAPEHPLVDKITSKKYKKNVQDYRELAKYKTPLERTEMQKEKTGTFCGAYAINPFNNTRVPIYVADYVLANYGTGAVMAVPAHDERDFEFAKRYNLPIKCVIENVHYIQEGEGVADIYEKTNKKIFDKLPEILTEKGILRRSGEFTGLTSDAAIPAMQTRLTKNKIGGEKLNYKIQDWVFSRQRYRGEPFPILRVDGVKNISYTLNFYKQEAWNGVISGSKTIETRALNPEEGERFFGNIKSGDVIKFINKGSSTLPEQESILVRATKVFQRKNFDELWKEDKEILEQIFADKEEFRKIKTVKGLKKYRDFLPGYVEKIEKNGLMGFAFEKVVSKPVASDESDLPLLLPDVENYEPTGTTEGPLANVADRVNVTLPDGSKARRETNTMPGRAGSSRYWLRYMDPENDKQLVAPAKEKYRGSVDVYIGGAEHVTRHMIYGRFWQKFLYDIGAITHDEPFQEYHYVGLIMGEDGRKMSKRRKNVVNPDDIINEYGADALRAYEMFMGPFDLPIARSTNGIKGVKKFLDKIIALHDKIDTGTLQTLGTGGTGGTLSLLHQTIKKVGEDINVFKFNTAISQLMILVNHLTEQNKIDKKTFENLVVLIAPFAPHLAEELREQLGYEYSLFTKAARPSYDEKYLVSTTVNIGVQINGKVRGTITISKEATEAEVMSLAKADPKIAAHLTAEPKKIIYVQGKILNIVI